MNKKAKDQKNEKVKAKGKADKSPAKASASKSTGKEDSKSAKQGRPKAKKSGPLAVLSKDVKKLQDKDKDKDEQKKRKPKKAKDLAKPKGASSAYIHYATHQVPLLKKDPKYLKKDGTFVDKDGTPMKHTDFMGLAGGLWGSLSEKEAAQFHAMAEKDKERHAKEMEEWREHGYYTRPDGTKSADAVEEDEKKLNADAAKDEEDLEESDESPKKKVARKPKQKEESKASASPKKGKNKSAAKDKKPAKGKIEKGTKPSETSSEDEE